MHVPTKQRSYTSQPTGLIARVYVCFSRWCLFEPNQCIRPSQQTALTARDRACSSSSCLFLEFVPVPRVRARSSSSCLFLEFVPVPRIPIRACSSNSCLFKTSQSFYTSQQTGSLARRCVFKSNQINADIWHKAAHFVRDSVHSQIISCAFLLFYVYFIST